MAASATTEQKLWTSLSLIHWGAEYLGSKQIDSPRLTCELLLASALQCSRIDLYTKFDRPLSQDELGRFKVILKRRLSREPLQYILGDTEFMGLKFKVDPRVLIPRPETEALVEQALLLAKNASARYILDIGTGSGNIAISLATKLGECTIDAVDVSDGALEVAASNIAFHKCSNVNLARADILKADCILPRAHYDCIVSNPPYVSQNEFSSLQPEVRDFEPNLATTDEGDGLTFYHAIAALGKRSLNPGGWVAAEHAYNQSDEVQSIFRNAGYRNIGIAHDYDRTPRIVRAQNVCEP